MYPSTFTLGCLIIVFLYTLYHTFMYDFSMFLFFALLFLVWLYSAQVLRDEIHLLHAHLMELEARISNQLQSLKNNLMGVVSNEDH